MKSEKLFTAASRIFKAASRPFVRQEPDTQELIESSRTRWRQATPDSHLTWGKTLRGDNFVHKIASYGGFGPDKSMLEVGPGYGRLLTACLENHAPFRDYLGVDISVKTVDHLKKAFPVSNVDFMVGDIETLSLNRSFDVFFSSLTLKHFFPTFEAALRNISSKLLNKHAKVFFDLLEGEGVNWEHDKTYVRSYTRAEVVAILSRANLKFKAFDSVEHDPEHVRLLVSAEKA